MIWYRLFDFIKTRNGQVLVFSVVLAGMFLAAARIHRARQNAATTEESRLPQLSHDQFWESGKGDNQFGKSEEFEVAEVNPSSTPFRLPPKRESPPKPEQVEVTRVEPEAVFSPLSSLIVFQRSTPPVSSEEEAVGDTAVEEAKLVELEPGRLLYCQLIAPVSSGQGSAPVLAQLTRAYVVAGRVVLPLGTRLSGQLQGANEERMNFNNQWFATLPSGDRMSFSGVLQEASFDPKQGIYLASDGLAGLPGSTAQRVVDKNERSKLISTLLGAASRLAKDRVQTHIGEIVPASGRNVAIDGSSAILEEVFGNQESDRASGRSPLIVGAGTPFYLVVTGTGGD